MGAGMSKRLYITVCGNIGVGKTSLVNLLCQEFGWQHYYEEVRDHPYLDDYYKDMPRWGFHTQIFFLTQRLKQQQEIARIPTSVCRPLYLRGPRDIRQESSAPGDHGPARLPELPPAI